MLIKKTSALDRKLKKIEKELTAVGNDIRTAKARAGRETGDDRTQPQDVDPPAVAALRERRKSRGSSGRDERLADYLASSLEGGSSLRAEKRIQRNKAIFMAVLAAVVLLWVVLRLI